MFCSGRVDRPFLISKSSHLVEYGQKIPRLRMVTDDVSDKDFFRRWPGSLRLVFQQVGESSPAVDRKVAMRPFATVRDGLAIHGFPVGEGAR